MKPGWHEVNHISGELPDNPNMRLIAVDNGYGQLTEVPGWYDRSYNNWWMIGGKEPIGEVKSYSDSRLYKNESTN